MLEKARHTNHYFRARASGPFSFGTTMNYKELFATLESVANEKSLPTALVYTVLENALGSVFRKSLGEDALIEVSLNKESIEARRVWRIVADDARLDNPAREMRMMDAQEEWPDCEVGQTFTVSLDEPVWSRVAAQAFRQTLIQGIREAERERTRSEWEDRLNTMVSATVKRWEKGQLHVDVEGHEAVIEREHQIRGERPRVGQRLMVWVAGLNPTSRGPVLRVSRTDAGLLMALLEREVPEIYAGTVRVRACVRENGARSKVAVESLVNHVDPVAACVGMRGVRIQAVTNELGGERLDLMTWSEEPAELAVRALAPARVLRAIKDESQRRLYLAVHELDLSGARGPYEQNVRLVSRLVDWDVEVTTEEGLVTLLAEEHQAQSELLQSRLNIDADLANLLVTEGFVDAEVIALCDAAELLQLDLDEETALELRERAKNALETPAFPGANRWSQLPLSIQAALQARGVASWESLADCSVDELEGIEGLSADQAGELIMQARAAWFEDVSA